jgi:hypothetical protein
VIALGIVVIAWFRNVGPQQGFGWLMAGLLIFSGPSSCCLD